MNLSSSNDSLPVEDNSDSNNKEEETKKSNSHQLYDYKYDIH